MADFSFSDIVDLYIILVMAGGMQTNGGFNIYQNFNKGTMLITWNMMEIFQKLTLDPPPKIILERVWNRKNNVPLPISMMVLWELVHFKQTLDNHFQFPLSHYDDSQECILISRFHVLCFSCFCEIGTFYVKMDYFWSVTYLLLKEYTWTNQK